MQIPRWNQPAGCNRRKQVRGHPLPPQGSLRAHQKRGPAQSLPAPAGQRGRCFGSGDVVIVCASRIAAQAARPRRAQDRQRASPRWRRRVARSCRQRARPAPRRRARLRAQERRDAVTPKPPAPPAESSTPFLRLAAPRFVGDEREQWWCSVRSLSLFEPSPPSPLALARATTLSVYLSSQYICSVE
jgi:hypothetical protein